LSEWSIDCAIIFTVDAIGGAGFFRYAVSQFQSMGPIWNLCRVILGLKDEFYSKKICDRSLRKNSKKSYCYPKLIFYFFFSIPFLEFDRNLHRISSTDFKFHLKICIRSGVITFWIIDRWLKNFSKNSKCYNSWTDAYF
jgi:hypothetical protein